MMRASILSQIPWHNFYKKVVNFSRYMALDRVAPVGVLAYRGRMSDRRSFGITRQNLPMHPLAAGAAQVVADGNLGHPRPRPRVRSNRCS